VHEIKIWMLCTAEIDMADAITKSGIADFLINAAWCVCSTFNKALNASSGVATVGRNMLFGVHSMADGPKLGDIGIAKTVAKLPMKTKPSCNHITKLVIEYS